jgi:hypothetical protein
MRKRPARQRGRGSAGLRLALNFEKVGAMAEITGGALLLKCLKQEGVTTLFGVLDGSFNTLDL